MRIIFAFFLIFLAQFQVATAQTENDVKGDVLAALSTPLPITVIGPLFARDVNVTKEDDGFRVSLVEPMLMGLVPLKTLSFKMTPQGDKLYRVTDFKLPQKLEILNAVTLGLGATQFDGVWSADTRSYQTLAFQLNEVSVVPKGAVGSKVSIGSLSLEVAKEGEAGAVDSKFAIHARDVQSQGFPPDNVKIANLTAALNANGKEPVDLYAVLSRFAVLTAMQSDGDAALQFAESLRAKSYDRVVLNVAMDGVELRSPETGSNKKMQIAEAAGIADIVNVSPEEWGTVTVNFNAKKIHDNGYLDVQEMTLETGALSLDGSQIPIGTTLNAISKLQALSRGEAVSYKVSELLDGLLNMGALKLKSSATGIAFVPLVKTDPVVHVGSYALETGTEGFRDNKGKLLLAASFDGIDVKVSKFATAIGEKTYRTLNPQQLRYDLSISELNEPLLRKLMADVVIQSVDDYVGLAAPALVYAMALKPVIENKDVHFKSAEVDASWSARARFYPAWVLEPLPYEGSSKIKIAGLDKLAALFEEYLTTPPDLGGASSSDKTGLVFIKSFINTFKALAVFDGDAKTWNIAYPKAGQGLITVNDIEMRFPNITSYLTPLMMYGMGSGLGSNFGVGAVQAPLVVPETVEPEAVAPAIEAPAVEAPAQ
jgi:hypothetical protein